MFRMNKNSTEILDEGNLNKYQRAAHRRQLVYKAILENPYIVENKQLAEAAGFNMSDWSSKEYIKGSGFIQNMLRQGYIEKHLGKDGQEYFYVKNKEEILSESPAKPIKDEEEDMGPEGQPKADWVSEVITETIVENPTQYRGEILIKSSNGNILDIEFVNKTKEEIIDMINKTNLEVL